MYMSRTPNKQVVDADADFEPFDLERRFWPPMEIPRYGFMLPPLGSPNLTRPDACQQLPSLGFNPLGRPASGQGQVEMTNVPASFGERKAVESTVGEAKKINLPNKNEKERANRGEQAVLLHMYQTRLAHAGWEGEIRQSRSNYSSSGLCYRKTEILGAHMAMMMLLAYAEDVEECRWLTADEMWTRFRACTASISTCGEQSPSRRDNRQRELCKQNAAVGQLLKLAIEWTDELFDFAEMQNCPTESATGGERVRGFVAESLGLHRLRLQLAEDEFLQRKWALMTRFTPLACSMLRREKEEYEDIFRLGGRTARTERLA